MSQTSAGQGVASEQRLAYFRGNAHDGREAGIASVCTGLEVPRHRLERSGFLYVAKYEQPIEAHVGDVSAHSERVVGHPNQNFHGAGVSEQRSDRV